MQNLFEKLLLTARTGLKGTVVRGTIPIKQELINDVLQHAVVARSRGAIESFHVAVGEQHRIFVTVKVKKLPVQNLEFFIEKRSAHPLTSPHIVIRLIARGFWGVVSNVGIVSMLANVLASTFGGLSAAVRIDGPVVAINLRTVLEQLKMHQLVPLIQHIEIEGQRGRLVLHFAVMIE